MTAPEITRNVFSTLSTINLISFAIVLPQYFPNLYVQSHMKFSILCIYQIREIYNLDQIYLVIGILFVLFQLSIFLFNLFLKIRAWMQKKFYSFKLYVVNCLLSLFELIVLVWF